MKHWKENIDHFAERARGRGWSVSDVEMKKGMGTKDLKLLEEELGMSIPEQIRELLSQSRGWYFSWDAPKGDLPPKDLRTFYSGGIRNVVWSADHLIEAYLNFSSWPDSRKKKWKGHFPVYHLDNGDFLTLDDNQAVYYFSHEHEYYHGYQIARDLFSFLDHWTVLGCAGSVWWEWVDWLKKSEKREGYYQLDSGSDASQAFLAWLSSPIDTHRPRLIDAESDADFGLLDAAKNGDAEAVMSMLEHGARIDCSDNSDWQTEFKTAVVYAAINDDIKLLELLISKGASLATFMPPLAEAMLEASPNTLIWMIENGARLDPWVAEDKSALDRLVYRYQHSSKPDDKKPLSEEDFLNVLEVFLKAGADADAKRTTSTPMMSSPLKARKLLLQYGANPHARSEYGQSALHMVGSEEGIRLLLDRGLNINEFSLDEDPDKRRTPLMSVLKGWAEHPYVKETENFIRCGADPSLKDTKGRDAWYYVRHAETAELLHQYYPFKADSYNDILLNLIKVERMIYPYQLALIEFFVKFGVDLNAADENGNTFLHLFAKEVEILRSFEVFERLVQMGANPMTKNGKGKTAKSLIKWKPNRRWPY